MVRVRALLGALAVTLVLVASSAQAASVFGPARILAAPMEEESHPFRFAAAEMTAEPTQFQVSSEPRDRPEVTFGACGQPLCPPATVYGPPPAAYECDCTEVIPHPDCIPICKAKAPAPNPLMPYTTCKCPYGVALSQCPCGGPRPLVGEGFPITQAVDLTVPQKADERGFAPSVEPSNPLPPPQDNECRPNIARHGPGNCRTAPKSASACSSAGSNCVASSSSSSSTPAREVQCACKYAAPAPCRCVNVTGSKALVDDAEGFKGPFGKPGSLVDAFAKQIADKVLQAIAPQISGSVAAASASLSSPVGLSSTVSGSSLGSLSGSASVSSAETQCSSKEDCNKKFDKLLATGDPEAEKQLLVNESKRLKDLAREYKRMETELQKKIDTQVKKHGKANPALQKALARIKKQSARLTDAVSQARKETMKLVQ